VTRFTCGAGLFRQGGEGVRAVLRAAQPGTAILIGDEARDMEAAREVGIAGRLAAWGNADPAFLRAPALTLFFARMEQIAPLLTRLRMQVIAADHLLARRGPSGSSAGTRMSSGAWSTWAILVRVSRPPVARPVSIRDR
jgi:hypothetical protein